MPTDLFGGNPNFGVEPAQDAAPRDLFGGNANYGMQDAPRGTAAAQPDSSPDVDDGMHLNSFGRHLLANVGSAAQDTVKGTKLPGLSDLFPGDATLSRNAKNENFYNDLGIKKGLLDSISEGAMEYAPFGMGAAKIMQAGGKILPKFAQFMQKDPYFASSAMENALGGAAYDKAQGGSGAIGGIVGALSPLPAAATNAGLKYGAEKIAQSSIPGLTRKATDYMKNLLSPNDYTSQLKGQFSKAYDENTANWDMVNNSAKNIDQSLTKDVTIPSEPIASSIIDESGRPIMTQSLPKTISKIDFDNSPYHSYINDYISSIKKLDPAQQVKYSQSLNIASKAKEMAPESFSGLVDARQNMNRVLSDFLDPTGMTKPDMYSSQFIKGLNNNLKNENFQANAEKISDSEFNSFKSQWNKANKSHASLQDFYQSPDKLGNIVENPKLKQAMQGDTTEGNIIGQYAPKPSQTGTEGIEQLAKNMGSKQAAQDALQAYMSRKPLTSGVSTLDVANKYADLSPTQRDWIYGGTPQKKYLDAIENTRQAFGKEPARSLLTAGLHHGLSVGVPGALGYFGSELAGGDREQNILSAVSLMGASGIGKYLSRKLSPESVNRLVNYTRRSPANYGRYLNIPLQSAISGGRNNQ